MLAQIRFIQIPEGTDLREAQVFLPDGRLVTVEVQSSILIVRFNEEEITYSGSTPLYEPKCRKISKEDGDVVGEEYYIHKNEYENLKITRGDVRKTVIEYHVYLDSAGFAHLTYARMRACENEMVRRRLEV